MERPLCPLPPVQPGNSHSLQWLFSEPIQTQTLFPEAHPGQASYVWHLITGAEDVIVRTSRLASVRENSFWQGCRELFGVLPTEIEKMRYINTFLRKHSLIKVPKVLKTAYLDNVPYLVVERMPGQTLPSLQNLSLESVRKLGRNQALLHQGGRQQQCGSIGDEARQYHISNFGHKLAATMEAIALKHFSTHKSIHANLASMQQKARELTLSEACPVMLDMDPTQYLYQSDEGHDPQISALVDTEVYVLGPCELELIAFEYLLDGEHAKAFRQGYTSVREIPPLAAVRSLYRYFCLLIEIQGEVDFDTWMNWPTQF